MTKTHSKKEIEINKEELYKLSEQFIDRYFVEPNIYLLILLSYVTVNHYSKKSRHLDLESKIGLSIQFTPDLIKMLRDDKVINELEYDHLYTEYVKHESELTSIITAYSKLVSNHHKDPQKQSNCCFGTT